MKTALLINDEAGSAGSQGEIAIERARELGWDVCPFGDTRASTAARRAAESGYDLVIAGGGDGTVREVVQGLSEAERRVSFGVLPLGTGNDLARALRMPLEVEPAVRALSRASETGRTIELDLLQLSHGHGQSVCANSVNGGIAPLIREQMDPELKAKLGPLAFVWGALGSLKQLDRWEAKFRIDGGPVQQRSFVAFVVANGGSVGGGVQVAPVAELDDGLFDLVVIRADASLAELTIAAIQAKFGDLFASNCVEHLRGRELEIIEQPPHLAFTADGETIDEPLRRVRVLPGALRTLVGEK
jgi:diacylglycerol kinase (ATP)